MSAISITPSSLRSNRARDGFKGGGEVGLYSEMSWPRSEASTISSGVLSLPPATSPVFRGG